MEKKKQLKELTMESLAQVTGGASGKRVYKPIRPTGAQSLGAGGNGGDVGGSLS
jgi:bacteriocin-like protein